MCDRSRGRCAPLRQVLLSRGQALLSCVEVGLRPSTDGIGTCGREILGGHPTSKARLRRVRALVPARCGTNLARLHQRAQHEQASRDAAERAAEQTRPRSSRLRASAHKVASSTKMGLLGGERGRRHLRRRLINRTSVGRRPRPFSIVAASSTRAWSPFAARTSGACFQLGLRRTRPSCRSPSARTTRACSAAAAAIGLSKSAPVAADLRAASTQKVPQRARRGPQTVAFLRTNAASSCAAANVPRPCGSPNSASTMSAKCLSTAL